MDGRTFKQMVIILFLGIILVSLFTAYYLIFKFGCWREIREECNNELIHNLNAEFRFCVGELSIGEGVLECDSPYYSYKMDCSEGCGVEYKTPSRAAIRDVTTTTVDVNKEEIVEKYGLRTGA